MNGAGRVRLSSLAGLRASVIAHELRSLLLHAAQLRWYLGCGLRPAATPAAMRLRTLIWQQRRILLALLASWGLLMLWLQHHALSWREGALWAGHLNIWSDWPLHMGMAMGFAERPPAQWLDHHPMFAHGALTYPFVVNLLSGGLLRLGLSLDWAMTLPTLLASLLTPLLLYALLCTLTRSRAAGVLALALFYLGSGLGGFDYLWQLMQSGQWQQLAYPAIEVSRIDRYDWYSGNVLVGMLLPQRAFVFGFPWALLSLLCLLRAQQLDDLRWSCTGGLLAGLLPLIHTHSYIALALIGLAFALVHLRRWRVWLGFALPAALLGGLLAWLFLANALGSGDPQRAAGGLSRHLQWAPGFAADGGWLEWLRMWWRLWGLSGPLVLLATIALWRHSPQLRFALLAGGLCFLCANLLLIQPNRWDNAKIFLWAWALWTGPLALGLLRLLAAGGARRLVALLLVLSLSLTGVIEIWRLVQVDRGGYQIVDRDTVQLMQQLRELTPADAVFATATTHNHPVMALAGRPILLGFTGWMANLGFDYRPREQALKQIYSGDSQAAALLARYAVDYIVVGPAERHQYQLGAHALDGRYPLLLRGNGWAVYRVTQP